MDSLGGDLGQYLFQNTFKNSVFFVTVSRTSEGICQKVRVRIALN